MLNVYNPMLFILFMSVREQHRKIIMMKEHFSPVSPSLRFFSFIYSLFYMYIFECAFRTLYSVLCRCQMFFFSKIQRI